MGLKQWDDTVWFAHLFCGCIPESRYDFIEDMLLKTLLGNGDAKNQKNHIFTFKDLTI